MHFYACVSKKIQIAIIKYCLKINRHFTYYFTYNVN